MLDTVVDWVDPFCGLVWLLSSETLKPGDNILNFFSPAKEASAQLELPRISQG